MGMLPKLWPRPLAFLCLTHSSLTPPCYNVTGLFLGLLLTVLHLTTASNPPPTQVFPSLGPYQSFYPYQPNQDIQYSHYIVNYFVFIVWILWLMRGAVRL